MVDQCVPFIQLKYWLSYHLTIASWLSVWSHVSFQCWLLRVCSSWCWSVWSCFHRCQRGTIPLTLRMKDQLVCHEDEVEGLATKPRVARRGARILAAVVKKRALKWVKQQVLALLHGEDLHEGAQAREVAEIPYQPPAVPREAKDCLVCQQRFKIHHRLIKHMGLHRGEKFPCDKCGKVLSSRRILKRHISACVQGRKVLCPYCGKEYAGTQGMKQYHKANHGADAPEMDEGFYCPHCNKLFQVKKSQLEHMPVCADNPNRKGPFFCRVPGCPSADHTFSHMKNLNSHLPNVHGWVERQV